MEISWKGASGFRDRIRRRAVFEKLGYDRTGAVTLISVHLCPRLRVHVLRVSRPAKHRNRAQCTAEFHSVYTRTRARACAHKFAFSIVTYLGLRTSGSSSRLFTLPSRKLLVHDYIFFLLSLSLPPRNTSPKSKSLFEKILGGEFFLGFFQKIDGCRVIEIHTDISSRISSFFSSTGMINGIGRERERKDSYS